MNRMDVVEVSVGKRGNFGLAYDYFRYMAGGIHYVDTRLEADMHCRRGFGGSYGAAFGGDYRNLTLGEAFHHDSTADGADVYSGITVEAGYAAEVDVGRVRRARLAAVVDGCDKVGVFTTLAGGGVGVGRLGKERGVEFLPIWLRWMRGRRRSKPRRRYRPCVRPAFL